jgi:oligoribonuclease (3'-5' exoribonuclease)
MQRFGLLVKVRDSPNQQGQDKVNLPTILKFISEHLPKDSQIILGSEIDAEHFFDKRIMLNIPYSLLLEEEYEQVNKVINPRVDLMYAQLKAKQNASMQSV